MICDAPSRQFNSETSRDKWVEERLEKYTEDRFHSVNVEHLNEDSPYVEYRCLGGVGYHLRYNTMAKGVMDMASNMKRALPEGRGHGFMTTKLKECFKVKGVKKEKAFVPH